MFANNDHSGERLHAQSAEVIPSLRVVTPADVVDRRPPKPEHRRPFTEGEYWLDLVGFIDIADARAIKVVDGKEKLVRAGDFDQVCGDHVRGHFEKFAQMKEAFDTHGIKLKGYDMYEQSLQNAIRTHFQEAFDPQTGQMLILVPPSDAITTQS